MSKSLQIIEERIQKLEKIVQSLPGDQTFDNNATLNENLTILYEKLDNLSSNRDKIKEAFAKASDLNPTFLDEPSAPEKYRILELRCQETQDRCSQLEKLQHLLPVLDSAHLQNVPSICKKLEALNLKQIEQRSNVKKSVDEINDLVKKYNDMIILMNKQFIVWDQVLSKLEKNAKP